MGTTKRYSWSVTRSGMLRDCPRKAFFEYYSDGEPEASAAWNLKELTNLPMLAGDVVDIVVAGALKRAAIGETPPKPLADTGEKEFRKFLAKSADLIQVMRTRPRTYSERNRLPFKPLQHEWYGYDLGRDYDETLVDRVRKCLSVFESSEIFERIRGIDPKQWGPFTRSLRVRPHFQLADVRVYASFDFYCRDGDRLVVLDWKSGKPSPSARSAAVRQLAVYSLYGKIELRFDPSAISTQAVWLLDSADWLPEPVDSATLIDTEREILAEVEVERSLLTQRMVRGETLFEADRAQFPPRPDSKRCLECKYREICPEGQAACSHVSAVASPV